MNPVTRAILQSWDVRLDVSLILVVLGTLYVLGWRTLRRTEKYPGILASGWQLTAYLAGLGLVALALMSPIDTLGGQLFIFHMVQHLLLIMIVAPLLLLGNPFPFVLWGLPRPIRQPIGRLFRRKSAFRQLLTTATNPGISWLIFTAFYVGWHDPNLYNAALRSDAVHDFEHLSFLLSAILFWWHIIPAAPYLRQPMPIFIRLGYLLAAVVPNMATGASIAFASEPIYTYYTAIPRVMGFTVMQDQMVGGIIMWVPGSMMYIVAAIIVVIVHFNKQKTTSLEGIPSRYRNYEY